VTTLLEDTQEVSEARYAARRLELRSGPPDEVALLERSRKSTVLRLAWRHPRRWKVVLKRCNAATAEIEATVHAEILPRIPVRVPRLFGIWRENSAAWLAIEDMGDEAPRLEDDRHRARVSRWLGELHAVSRELADVPQLPDRGAQHYLRLLRRARTRLVERRAEAPGGDHERRLGQAIDICDSLGSLWAEVQTGAALLPAAFVHADMAPENLRIVHSSGLLEVTAIDWEKAGFGTPFADLAMSDPSAYAAAAGAPIETVRSSMWVARLLETLSHNWASKRMSEMEQYARRLERALGVICER
jgi:aminoglycoside phosphotransferase (APT) family kinase protein